MDVDFLGISLFLAVDHVRASSYKTWFPDQIRCIRIYTGGNNVHFTMGQDTNTSVAVDSPAAGGVVAELSKEQAVVDATPVTSDARSTPSERSEGGRSVHVPLKMKILAVLLVTLIGFGSHWSSGVTGAMKSTLKRVSHCCIGCPLKTDPLSRSLTLIIPAMPFSKQVRILWSLY